MRHVADSLLSFVFLIYIPVECVFKKEFVEICKRYNEDNEGSHQCSPVPSRGWAFIEAAPHPHSSIPVLLVSISGIFVTIQEYLQNERNSYKYLGVWNIWEELAIRTVTVNIECMNQWKFLLDFLWLDKFYFGKMACVKFSNLVT